MVLPRRLKAPAPTWEARRRRRRVGLRCGRVVGGVGRSAGPQRARGHQGRRWKPGSTQWAQGGLAGVLDPADSTENHVRDTLAAGAGLCDEDGRSGQLVDEAPTSIRYLMRLGAAFDPDHDPEPRPGLDLDIALTREGGPQPRSHRPFRW